jgi:hypothetical protein
MRAFLIFVFLAFYRHVFFSPVNFKGSLFGPFVVSNRGFAMTPKLGTQIQQNAAIPKKEWSWHLSMVSLGYRCPFSFQWTVSGAEE